MLLSWAASSGVASADTVIYDSASVVDGQQGYVEPFSITTPGTLTITILNIPWLDVVTDLTSYLSTTNGVIGSTMYKAGTESVSESVDRSRCTTPSDADGADASSCVRNAATRS